MRRTRYLVRLLPLSMISESFFSQASRKKWASFLITWWLLYSQGISYSLISYFLLASFLFLTDLILTLVWVLVSYVLLVSPHWTDDPRTITPLHLVSTWSSFFHGAWAKPRIDTVRFVVYRYKIVVQVTIGEMKDQGVRVASRCLWDTATDNYASVNFKNQSLWCSAMVFGVYTE